MSSNILLIGATGYVGGAILALLAKIPEYSITVTVRQQAHADKFNSLGFKAVIATLDDAEILERLASEADIVIQTASSAHLPSTAALLKGLAQRKEATGKETHYIHTSGSSIFSDNAIGEFKSDTIYTDTDDIYALESADSAYPFRAADVAVVDGGIKNGVKTYIVVPPTIFGISDGIYHKTSIQGPALIRAASKTQQVQVIGKGLAAWSHVSVADTASLFVTLVNKALKNEAPYGKSGYYFPESGEHSWKELSEGIAKAFPTGALKSIEVTSFESSQAAADAIMGGNLMFSNIGFGSNSRIRGNRSRQIGWTPVDTDDAIYKGLPAEIDAVLKGL